MEGSKNRVLALLAAVAAVGIAPAAAAGGAASSSPQSWGNNSSGQLGDGTHGGVSASPGPIPGSGPSADRNPAGTASSRSKAPSSARSWAAHGKTE